MAIAMGAADISPSNDQGLRPVLKTDRGATFFFFGNGPREVCGVVMCDVTSGETLQRRASSVRWLDPRSGYE